MDKPRTALRRLTDRIRSRSLAEIRSVGSIGRRLVPAPVRKSYARKLVSLFLVVIVLFAGLAAFEYRAVAAEVQSDAQADVEQTATLQANQLSEWMKQREETTRMLSAYDLYDSRPDHVSETLSGERWKLPAGYPAVHYVDTDSGRIVASSNSSMIDQRPWEGTGLIVSAESSHVDDVARTNPYTAASGKRVIAFASRVEGQSGAVVVIADVSVLQSRLDTEMDGSSVYVVTSRGDTLFASDSNGDENASADASELVAETNVLSEAIRGDSGIIERDADETMNESYLLSYAPAGDGVVVLVTVPTQTAYSLQNTVGAHFLLIVGLAVVSLAVVGYLLRRITVRPLDRLTEAVAELRAGALDTDLEARREDEFGSVFEGVSQMRDDLRDQRTDAEAYRGVMERAAAGDLTARMDDDSRSREMATIAEAFNGMMDEIEATVVTVSQFGEEVARLGAEVADSTERVSQTSQEVAESIEQISGGAEEQSDRLTDVTREVNDLSASVQQIASAADELAELSAETAERAHGGADAAGDALDGMDDIRAETERAAEEVERLDERLGEIGEVVEVITDVAEQTNVLALNAQIEAARAGEEGEGFAVVSREVKSLAEETRDSAEEISALVDDIGEQRERVVERMDRMRDGVREGASDVEGALESLDGIVDQIETTNASVHEITDATGEQASSAQEVLAMADEIASIAEETASEAGAVATAAEGQTTTLAEVDGRMQSLSTDTGRLVSMLDRFDARDSRAATMDGLGGDDDPRDGGSGSSPESPGTDGNASDSAAGTVERDDASAGAAEPDGESGATPAATDGGAER